MAEYLPYGEFTGRRKIYTSYDTITAENVVTALNDALMYHIQNARAMEYLYWYRRGIQPILEKKKDVRPEINHKVRINNAARIVSFKNGYFLSKPCNYITRKDDDKINDKVGQLNEYLYTSGKHHVDTEVVNSFHTMGLGNVYVAPNPEKDKRMPVICSYLDPRNSFVVYSLRPGNEPVFGVNQVVINEKLHFDLFTKDSLYRLSGSLTGEGIVTEIPTMNGTAITLDSVEPNLLGEIPIIEYQYNQARESAFECGLDIMDSINMLESLREDSVDQAVQQLCVAYNCQFEEGTTANTIREAGMICLKSENGEKADFQILTSYVDQSQTQTSIDDLTNRLDDICGIPSAARSNASTSDNVGAVYLRSGWSLADTDCRNTEEFFFKSNARFDRIFLKILKTTVGLDLNIDDFELCFPRNDVSNMLIKTQVAINLKALGFSPELALERSGVSSDPMTDVEQSRVYMDAIWTPIDMQTDTVGADVPVEAPGGDMDGNPNTENTVADKEAAELNVEAGNPQRRQKTKYKNREDQRGTHWVKGYWR